MPDRAQILATIREVIATTWPGRFDDEELRGDVSLGESGLELDSIEVIELLQMCEERCRRSTTPQLFEVVPLTIDRLADHFAHDSA